MRYLVTDAFLLDLIRKYLQDKLEFLPAMVSFVKHCGVDILGVQSTKNRLVYQSTGILKHVTFFHN